MNLPIAGHGVDSMRLTDLAANDRRLQMAVHELGRLMRDRYSEATFKVSLGNQPPGIYLHTPIDVQDVDELFDLFRDRMLSLGIDKAFPVCISRDVTPSE